MTTVAFIVGSLRKEAYTRKVANALHELAPSLTLNEAAIGDLPFYNEDLETQTPPASWTALRDSVRSADGVVFITPEYNRGIPGALKNAIDVGSRPRVVGVWRNKPALVISITPGKLGAMAANQQLRLCLLTVGSPVMPSPEIHIPDAAKLFDGNGKLIAEDVKKLLSGALKDFEGWIAKFK